MEWSGVQFSLLSPLGEGDTMPAVFEATDRRTRQVINQREPLPTGAWALTMPATTAEVKPKNQLIVADRMLPVLPNPTVFSIGGTQLRDRRSQQPHYTPMKSKDDDTLTSKGSEEGFTTINTETGITDFRSAVTHFYDYTHVKAERYLLPSDLTTTVTSGGITRTLRETAYFCELYRSSAPTNTTEEQTFLEQARLVYVNQLFVRIKDCYEKWRRAGWKEASSASIGKATWINGKTTTLADARTDRNNLISESTSWFPTMTASFQTHLATRMGDLGNLTTLAYSTTSMALTGKPVIVTTVSRGGASRPGYILLSRGGQTITDVGIQYKTTGSAYVKVSMSSTAQDQGQPSSFSYVAGNIYTVQAYVEYLGLTEVGTEEQYDTRPPVLGTASYNSSSATFTGLIRSEGGGSIIQTGVVYGASNLNDSVFTSWDGTGTNLTAVQTSAVAKFGSFSVTAPTVAAGTYKFAVYATNSFGRSVAIISNVVTFAVPSLGTTAFNTTVGSTSVSASSSVSASNGTISEVGFVWSTAQNPDISSPNKLVSSANSFAAQINLVSGNTYYLRAYATNQFGTGYSTQTTAVISADLYQDQIVRTLNASRIFISDVQHNVLPSQFTSFYGPDSIHSSDTNYYVVAARDSSATGSVNPNLITGNLTLNESYFNFYNYNNTSTGVIQWTVPSTGIYSIEAWGADGGRFLNTYATGPLQAAIRGRGAIVRGQFQLNSGEVLYILVGQIGDDAKASGDYLYAGSGGGGTFVVRKNATVRDPSLVSNNDILVIAGGGGGVLDRTYSNANATFPSGVNMASDGNSGIYTRGADSYIGTGGTLGNGGGGGGSFMNAGAGGGFVGNGENTYGGKAFKSSSNPGAAGGAGVASIAAGFGGGGASDLWYGIGGGGGYNGGGVGRYLNDPGYGWVTNYRGCGGGGGSYNADISNTRFNASRTDAWSDTTGKGGNGRVMIKWVSA